TGFEPATTCAQRSCPTARSATDRAADKFAPPPCLRWSLRIEGRMHARDLLTGVLVASLAACSPLSSPPDGSPGTSPDGGVGTSDGGTGSGGTGSDAGPVADAGSDNGGGAQDAGQGGGSGGNNQGGRGGGGGNVGCDCDGLVPAAPGAATEFRWSERDLREG